MSEQLPTIIAVDESITGRRLLRIAIERTGRAKILMVDDGIEAIEAARLYHPDAVILDSHLQRSEGEEVLATLKTDPLTTIIPVIVLADDLDDEHRQRLVGLGARAVITKIDDLNEMATDILRAIGLA